MPISKELLSERFEAIIQFEEDIKNEYDDFITMLNNKDGVVLKNIIKIRDWELKHIQLAKDLVDFIKK
jgi:demethoxyubiquinone hydroxylase (CLK1/Coq7/Cat5 family)